MDSFTDREAFSLMYYGYELSDKILQANRFKITEEIIADNAPDWRFLQIRDGFLTDNEGRKELLHHLEVGSHQMFKVFLLNKTVPYAIALPLPIIILLFSLFLIGKTSPMIFWLMALGAILIMIYTQNTRILKLMDNAAFLRKIKNRMVKILLSLRLPEPFSYLIALASWIHLAIFDRLFLRYGRISDKTDKKFLP
jgi:hypothetical protein